MNGAVLKLFADVSMSRRNGNTNGSVCLSVCRQSGIKKTIHWVNKVQLHIIRELSFFTGGGHLFVIAYRQFFSGPPFAYVKVFWSPLGKM